jgi:hypothetical protein
MVLATMLLAPAVMGFAAAVEQRLGAAAAGWAAALPVAFTTTVIGVGVAAQVGFAVCAVAAIRRRNLA